LAEHALGAAIKFLGVRHQIQSGGIITPFYFENGNHDVEVLYDWCEGNLIQILVSVFSVKHQQGYK